MRPSHPAVVRWSLVLTAAAERSFSILPRRRDGTIIFYFPFGINTSGMRECVRACVRACSRERASELDESDAETRRRLHGRTVDGRADDRAGGTSCACVRGSNRPTDHFRASACECVDRRCHARHALGRNVGTAPPRASKFGTGPGSRRGALRLPPLRRRSRSVRLKR